MEVAEPNTHLDIDRELCGKPVEIGESRAVVQFRADERMTVDDRGLVHGGFVFGLADHAAMLAVNHPNVVLIGAEVEFSAPVTLDDVAIATAEVIEREGAAYEVEATVEVDDREVVSGTFTAFVPEQYILEDDPAS